MTGSTSGTERNRTDSRSPSQSPSLYRADVATRKLTQLSKPARQVDVQVLDLLSGKSISRDVVFTVGS